MSGAGCRARRTWLKSTLSPRVVHIYCHVIDNFGDVGVCWRLARQLVHEHGLDVHLWVNDWSVARQLLGTHPAWVGEHVTSQEGVWLHAWDQALANRDCTGDVLIEGFACEIPEAVQQQLAGRSLKPVWINLEYFSAEPWAADYHLRSGYISALGARRWFFIPGVAANSGGLIRERGLLAERDAIVSRQESAALPGHVLVFGYAHAPHAELVDALQGANPGPIDLHVCGTYSQRALPQTTLTPGVRIHHEPFVGQPEFDRLIWRSDLAFVRGEDSFARALWSGRPFVWNIYPQGELAHAVKLQAWLDNYLQEASPELRVAITHIHLAWNNLPGAQSLGDSWTTLMHLWPAWRDHAWRRSAEYAAEPDLATRLMEEIHWLSVNK